MSARIFWMNHAQRLGLAVAPAFVSYKAIIAAVSNRIPGQPFYGFTARDWVGWVFHPGKRF